MKRSIPLFYPTIPQAARDAVQHTLKSQWIGQGPKVELFENKFQQKFNTYPTVAVGAGTDALHLAYILAGLKRGDEVIAPVFTCTATNLPLLWEGINIKFADIEKDSLNISVDHVKSLITRKTKAIVIVDYGGLPCNLAALQSLADDHKIPLIEDAAHSLGAKYHDGYIGGLSDFTIFSFQAIKLLTTGDGGMLTIKNAGKVEKARRLRWFGIDRKAKSLNNWDNQITEVGYKYQMNDIAASIGLATLPSVTSYIRHRRELFLEYKKLLKGIPGIKILNDEEKNKTHAHWLMTVAVEKRKDFEKSMEAHRIGSSQTHYRNDRYKIFGGKRKDLPNMDAMEDKYTLLPLTGKMTIADVAYICKLIRRGW